MNESVDIFSEIYEYTERSESCDFNFFDVADLVEVLCVKPRIILGLSVTERNLVLFSVETDDPDFDFLSFFENVLRASDPLP